MNDYEMMWENFKIAQLTNFTPHKGIERVANLIGEEDAKLNHKQDTLSLRSQREEDYLDMSDNLTNTGWAYND